VTDQLQKAKAQAYPTKAFFVRMITRDISLEDCILDLIDNSVDGAWRSEGSRPMGLAEGADLSKYSISITASAEQFSIKDNCGGMTLDNAADHAFSFGRPGLEQHQDYSIGVYGIGMKRAVFKLGTDVRVRSTYAIDGQQQQPFAVIIDVGSWLADDAPPWDFDIVSDEPLASRGVEIVVRGLTPGTSTSFANPLFLQNLRRTIARDYSLHLNRGLQIALNGLPIAGWNIELRQSAEFVPTRQDYEDEIGGEKVSVTIIGGMAAEPPDTSEPAEANDSDNRFGWYVACNGRIVLAADKTALSGWSVDWPQWHGQYSGFIGLILFTAANAVALPLTTTKRSVDPSSEVYRRARPRMREVTKAWTDYTNARKQALDQAKQTEAAAQPVSIYQIAQSSEVKLPIFTPRPVEPQATVNYSVPTSKMRALAKALGRITMSYREVGLRSFDYTYNDLAGDE
jgi:hypothetical protein